jgi:ABC-2 type transport system ATP-binding protein
VTPQSPTDVTDNAVTDLAMTDNAVIDNAVNDNAVADHVQSSSRTASSESASSGAAASEPETPESESSVTGATGSDARETDSSETDSSEASAPSSTETDSKPRPASPRSPRARSAAATRAASGSARIPAAPRAPRKPAAPRAKAAPSASDAPIVLDPAASAISAPAKKPAPKAVRLTAAQKKAAALAEAEAAERAAFRAQQPVVLSISGLVKKFGSTTAVDGIDLEVRQGSFYGIVGPNGAGKTTTLSMVTGLLRPDSGTISINGLDVWANPAQAKKIIGVLPDRLRLFDRLTGRQMLYYAGTLRGLDNKSVRERSDDLAAAFGLEDALGRLVTDYSAGMTKKIALAAAMIHSPRILVLDEPFESVDPVSAANVIEILQKYVETGGTVVLSSHSMDMIQRVCDGVAIIVQGQVLAQGTVDEVRRDGTLEDRFVELAGGRKAAEGMEWLLNSSN